MPYLSSKSFTGYVIREIYQPYLLSVPLSPTMYVMHVRRPSLHIHRSVPMRTENPL